jgi:hypothetical protein
MGLWCHAFNGHNLGDGASLDFSPCQQKAHGISFPRGYDYYSRKTASAQCTHLLLCWPPAMKPLRPALRSRSGEESGLLGSRRGSFFSRCRAGFIYLPRQVRQSPAQYTIGGQPSTTTNLHVPLGKHLHLQARPDNSHGRGAKYAGDVDKPGFGGRSLFGLSCCWFFSSSSRSRLRPAFDDRRLRLDNSS